MKQAYSDKSNEKCLKKYLIGLIFVSFRQIITFSVVKGITQNFKNYEIIYNKS